jgi:hypothetical protein
VGDKSKERLLSSSQLPKQAHRFEATSQNALYSCVLTAYAEHRPLQLRPDDLYLPILTGAAFHVNAHGACTDCLFLRVLPDVALTSVRSGCLQPRRSAASS